MELGARLLPHSGEKGAPLRKGKWNGGGGAEES